MGLHQETGSPTGTGSIIPLATSLSRLALTSSFQWMGTGMGTWTADGMAFSFRWICTGLQFIVLNGVDLTKTSGNSFMRLSFSLQILSSTGEYGSVDSALDSI